MNVVLGIGLALTVAALAAAVLAFRRVAARERALAALMKLERPALNLPANKQKFRVAFYTESGARARDLFALLQPRDDDRIELWHFGDVRGRKP